MISLIVISNRLWVTGPSGAECKPWGVDVFGEKITISSLMDNKSVYTGTYSDFANESGAFASQSELIQFISPYLGFKSAPGGSGASYNSASVLKTGQTLSHYPNDDGAVQAGRAVSFWELPSNNPFGNTNRFTDLIGGSDYTEPIAIDWSTFDGTTVLGWSIDIDSIPADSWTVLMDFCQPLEISGFSGWRMPNNKEALNLCQYIDYGFPALGYAPFNFLAAEGFWTSTNSANHALYVSNIWGTLTYYTKNGSARTIPVRPFTLNELGL